MARGEQAFMRMSRHLALAGALLAMAAPAARAAQLIVPFEARITIITACTVSASNLNFGNVGIITGTDWTRLFGMLGVWFW